MNKIFKNNKMKNLLISAIMLLSFSFVKAQSNMWRGTSNEGFITTFHRIDKEKWTETNNDDIFYYKEVKNEVNMIILKDVYREGVFIKLIGKQCLYKDNNNDWTVIYNGYWKY